MTRQRESRSMEALRRSWHKLLLGVVTILTTLAATFIETQATGLAEKFSENKSMSERHRAHVLAEFRAVNLRLCLLERRARVAHPCPPSNLEGDP